MLELTGATNDSSLDLRLSGGIALKGSNQLRPISEWLELNTSTVRFFCFELAFLLLISDAFAHVVQLFNSTTLKLEGTGILPMKFKVIANIGPAFAVPIDVDVKLNMTVGATFVL